MADIMQDMRLKCPQPAPEGRFGGPIQNFEARGAVPFGRPQPVRLTLTR
jgi:hypothetical protein